jgi:hypothetical protein
MCSLNQCFELIMRVKCVYDIYTDDTPDTLMSLKHNIRYVVDNYFSIP